MFQLEWEQYFLRSVIITVIGYTFANKQLSSNRIITRILVLNLLSPDYSISPITVKHADMLKKWNDILCDSFHGVVIDSDIINFKGEIDLWKHELINIVRVRAQKSVVRRWLNEQPEFNSGSILIHLQSIGQSSTEQCGIETITYPGEATLCRPDVKFTVKHPGDHELFIMEIPVTQIISRYPVFDPERMVCRHVTGPKSRLLLAFFRSVWQEALHLEDDRECRDNIGRICLDLSIQMIAGVTDKDFVGKAAEMHRKVIEYVNNNLRDPELRTSYIARNLDVSSRTIQSVFNRMATTPSNFILERRLSLAAETLRTERGKGNIFELARNCGFNNPAYFSRCFKLYFGVSPKIYRKEPYIHDMVKIHKFSSYNTN